MNLWQKLQDTYMYMCFMVVNVLLHGGHDIRWSITDIPSLNVYYKNVHPHLKNFKRID